MLASERTLAREKKPLAYRSFVTELARAGDLGAQRVLDALVAPTRNRREHVPHREPRPVTLAEIRSAAQRHTRGGRRALSAGSARAPAPAACRASAHTRRSAGCRAAERFTASGRRYRRHKVPSEFGWRSSPGKAVVESAGAPRRGKGRKTIAASSARATKKRLADATHEFEQRDLPELEKQLASHERAYRRYVAASLGLEREMNNARAAQRRRTEDGQRLNVLERAGTSRASIAALRSAPHGSTALLRRSSSSIELYHTRFGKTLSTAFAKSNVRATP